MGEEARAREASCATRHPPVELAMSIQPPHGQTTAELRRRQDYYFEYGLAVAAVDAGQEWLTLAEELGHPEEQLDALVAMAMSEAFLLGWYDKAEMHACRAIQLTEGAMARSHKARWHRRSDTRLATAYSILGYIADRRHQYTEALWALERMPEVLKPLLDQAPDQLEIAEQRTLLRMYINLGMAYSQVNDLDKAIATAEQGLRFAQAIDRSIGIQLLLANLCRYCTQAGHYEKAGAYLDQLEAALDPSAGLEGQLGLVAGYFELRAGLHFRLGEIEQAWHFATQALEYHVRQPFIVDREIVAETNALVGLMYIAVGEYDHGVECLERAQRLYRSMGLANKADGLQLHLALQHIQATLNIAPGSSEGAARCTIGLSEDMERRFLLTSRILEFLFELYDNFPYVAEHSDRVVRYSQILAEELSAPPDVRDAIAYIGPVHDVGKINIPTEVLNKPGELTPDERALLQSHTEHGAHMLMEALDLSETAVALLRHHHERWDGTGYPAGLKGEDIPLVARIVAVADAYDAMTSDRPYRQRQPHRRAMAQLREGAGTQFDPQVVAAWEHIHRVPDDFVGTPAW